MFALAKGFVGNRTYLKFESDEKDHYKIYIFKIYLLPDKTFSGEVTSKAFDSISDSPLVAASKESSLKRTTVLSIEQASEGPSKQKLDTICAPIK